MLYSVLFLLLTVCDTDTKYKENIGRQAHLIMHSVTVVAIELLKITESVKLIYHVTQNMSISSIQSFCANNHLTNIMPCNHINNE